MTHAIGGIWFARSFSVKRSGRRKRLIRRKISDAEIKTVAIWTCYHNSLILLMPKTLTWCIEFPKARKWQLRNRCSHRRCYDTSPRYQIVTRRKSKVVGFSISADRTIPMFPLENYWTDFVRFVRTINWCLCYFVTKTLRFKKEWFGRWLFTLTPLAYEQALHWRRKCFVTASYFDSLKKMNELSKVQRKTLGKRSDTETAKRNFILIARETAWCLPWSGARKRTKTPTTFLSR
jgi:hypothetical protein